MALELQLPESKSLMKISVQIFGDHENLVIILRTHGNFLGIILNI